MISLRIVKGIMIKELLQLKRERLTFGIVVLAPIVLLLLFGYAINNDPKNMPAAVIGGNQSEFTRSFVVALENSDYYNIDYSIQTEAAARNALQSGKAQFVFTIPVDFTEKLMRGEHPKILMEVDATDPTAVAHAAAAIPGIIQSALSKDLPAYGQKSPYDIIVHSKYNPEKITRYNIVPGLIGVILTITLVMMTGLSMTRERERGTMENLLVMPVKPLEVILGKLAPYVIIGMLQSALILTVAYFLFRIPFEGHLSTAVLAILLFEMAVLAVGITISSAAKSQLQAMQMTIFFFLPNILLSGFMFPFKGMPAWAQTLGGVLPLTYFNRMIRGVLLKGSTAAEIWPHIWPLLVFITVVMLIAVRAYRKTLD